ncbi:alpha-2-macroglobulin family protein [Aquimarina agarilytica]|uniref:alpha-2-macroglobulin family protein n=1 Tax=Aquimarina agarilytica TaxID=1087449 RepID=UPI000288182E|nr:MG2 domain-containing protein [Aquimarina agarilytica]
MWQTIEQLEIDGKVSTALEKVNELHKKATQQKNKVQQLKSLLFRWKFMQIVDEKSQVIILNEVNAEITKQAFPNKQLLHMYMAHFLESYLNDNYWRINERTTTEDAQLKDYQTWDINTFLNQISLNYQQALLPALTLADVPTKTISELLVTVPISRKYKPTAYDIIAHKALKFYKNSRNRAHTPKDEFLINTAAYFTNSSTFVGSKLGTTDTNSLLFKALSTYQQLEKIHSQQKSTTAWVENALERLAFVKANHIGNTTETLYLESLQNLRKEFSKAKDMATIDIKLAQAYRDLSFAKNEDGNFKYPDYNQKALDLIAGIESQKVNTQTLIEAKNLKNQILQKKLNWLTQDKYLPNQPHLAQATFTNCQNFTLNAYQVPVDFELNQISYNNRDSLTEAYLAKRKLHFTKTYNLPPKKDHNTYSTEVSVPQLPLGNYVFRIQTDSLTTSFKYHHVKVTRIGVNKTNLKNSNRYQVTDRYTGEPLVNAAVRIKTEIDRRNKKYTTENYTTDQWGNYEVQKKNHYQSQQIRISTATDTLQFSDYVYNNERDKDYLSEQNDYRSKTLLFLDRAIYRPGQTVYFKAIAVSEENKKSTVIPNQKIRIQVSDTNNEKVHTTELYTNEYGSVHGEFKLPETGITGNFTISALIENPKNRKRNYNATISFSVEEYKRPTFEVSFLPATKIYKPLDSIKVTGNAKAFLGTAITDATVNYAVTRTTQYRAYWWSRPTSNESKQIAVGELTTDHKGDFAIRFKAETDEADTKDKIYHYSIAAKVIDLNAETREATTTIKVAEKNLITTINTSETWKSHESNNLSINTTDVNGNPIKSNGTLKIFKLKAPDRFLNVRPWSAPDIQNIDKSTFIEQFPHIPFTNENDAQNWQKGRSFYDRTFKNTDNETIKIDNFKTWPSGKYLIVVTSVDPITKADTKTEKLITLEHIDQRFPADKQLFTHHAKMVNNNSSKLAIDIKTSAPNLTAFVEVFDGDISISKQKIALKKGSKSILVPLKNLSYTKLTVVYTYQIFNHFYTTQDTIDLSKKPITLSITKKHFTDKITPGGKETWSFSIESSDKKGFNAEALASMYDASLDQFRKHSWATNFGFNSYTPSPTLPSDMQRLNTTSISFRQAIARLNYPDIPKEYLNLFGFDFNVINSWNYRKYLRELKNKVNHPKKIKFKDRGTISGVISTDNIPLPGVSITIKNSQLNTVTDFDGEFNIDVKVNDVLIIEYIGYIKKEILIKGNTSYFEVNLEGDHNSLNEIIVVGYGTHKKSELTGAVTNSMARKSLHTQKSSMMLNSSEDLELEEDEEIGFSRKKPPLPEEEKQASEKIEDLKNIQARTNLQETAFFLPNLRTNKKGEIEFEFTSPEALTRWNFNLLAHTPQAISGTFNAQTLTQKELSIIPNAPRFVREGDSLRFTAKIANLTDNSIKGTALLDWTDPTNGKNINKQLQHVNTTQPFNIDANGNSAVSWKIAIPADLSALQYKIVAKAGKYTDGEEKIIPVLSNRMLVTESIPIWVRPGETETYSLTNFEPNSSTQKPHTITLEYTSNPAWVAIKSLPYLMEFPHECSEQTFSRLYANTMAAHIINSQPKIKTVFDSWAANGSLQSPLEKNEVLKQILISESPWLQQAKSETEQQQRLATLFDINKTARNQEKSINKLRQLQKSNGGFPWFNGGRANPYITRHILIGFGHLEKLGVTQQRTKTDNIVKNMIRFLDADLLYKYNEYLKYHKTPDGFFKQVQLLHFAYARSFYLDRFPLKGEVKTIITKALTFQKTDWQSRSIYQKGLLALTLHRFEKSPVTQQILTALIESAVNSKENGMYWKENTNSWWWYQSAISTQALLIEAFSETKQPKKYIEELKIFLLKNKRTNRWETTIETADASYALLLQGTDWLSLKDNTNITVGGNKIATKKLLATEKEQGTGYFKTHWNSDEITPDFKTIRVSNKGKVTNYGGYYWQYFEDLDHIKTDDKSPLAIDKELYKKVTTSKGTELKRITPSTPLQIGDKVTVRLLVKSANDMEFVHLKDMRASGFEPTKVLSGYEYKERLAYYQSTKDVATHFFIDRLPKGTYVLEYDVIANQSGSFSNGITTLQCMYAPEFSSHSAGQRIHILEQ